MLQQHRLRMGMPPEKSHQFRAAIAAEPDDADRGTHGYLFTAMNNYTRTARLAPDAQTQASFPTAFCKGLFKTNIASPEPMASAASSRKNESRDIFS